MSKQHHILVVDDEPPICDLLQSYFTKRGYRITTANSAAELKGIDPGADLDLIILDIMLPDVNGMDLLEELRQDHPSIPIVIMTGMGFDEELVREAKGKGASGYVSKTLSLDQLLMEVHRHLKYG